MAESGQPYASIHMPPCPTLNYDNDSRNIDVQTLVETDEFSKYEDSRGRFRTFPHTCGDRRGRGWCIKVVGVVVIVVAVVALLLWNISIQTALNKVTNV